jgi:hypothetical protein
MSVVGDTARPVPLIQWAPIFAGAVSAAGYSFTLHAFAAGIGLSVMSSAPTWRDSSPWLWLLSGLYLLFVAISAFALGGYVAGRFREPLIDANVPEVEYRDGIHGLTTWGLGVLLTALLALGVAVTAAPAVAPGGTAGASQSVAGENIIAAELDVLFRSQRVAPDMAYRRAEAGRILLKAGSHAGVTNEDRASLATIVTATTGTSSEVASARIDRAVSAAADELHKARVAAVLQAFMIGAALLVGSAIAWCAAVEGGRDRALGRFPGFARRTSVRAS